jgi:hypothetical protein
MDMTHKFRIHGRHTLLFRERERKPFPKTQASEEFIVLDDYIVVCCKLIEIEQVVLLILVVELEINSGDLGGIEVRGWCF